MQVALIVLSFAALVAGNLEDFICDRCHEYAGDLDQLLANPANQGKVRRVLEKVCDIVNLFGDEATHQKCIDKTDEFVNKMMQGAANDLEPKKFCQQIHVCKAEQKRNIPTLNIDWDAMEKKACDECHVIAGKVDSMLANPANQAKARKFLEGACYVLKIVGEDYYNSCVTKVDQTVNEILSGAVRGLEPVHFCQSIHICKAKQIKRDFWDSMSAKACDECHTVAGKVDTMLSDPRNQQTARKVLEVSCLVYKVSDKLMGGNKYDECIAKIDQCVTDVMTGAVAKFEPVKFCQDIQICQAPKISKKRDISGAICDSCHSFVGKVDHVFADPENQHKARSLLEKACFVFKLFSDQAGFDKCVSDIDDVVNQVMNDAASKLEPNSFCQSIHACPNQKAITTRDAFTDFVAEVRDKACAKCRSTVASIDKFLDSPKNEDTVRKFFRKFCGFAALFRNDAAYDDCVNNVDHQVYRVMVGVAEIQLLPDKFCRDQTHICRA